MNESRYLTVVKGFGLYHMLVSLPLAIPILSGIVLDLLGGIHSGLSLPGTWPAFDPTSLLFLNLFGALAFTWGLLRFRSPSLLIGRYEGWAMVAFVVIVLWAVVSGASALWLVIAIVDGIGAYLHLRK